MAESRGPRPTDAELEILKVLWRRGPSTVREVFETLGETKQMGYTTALKLMQIMAEKGLVRRDESERAHRYEAAAPEEETQRQLVGDLLQKAFDGSAKKLVLQALSRDAASAGELAEIRRMLDELEEGGRR
ncbi:MAG TPA: BlaI/MecI/CopY family transcriptional regulator [Pyrinomonadaceae bacterium]|jgi:predicted transcriptional regulator|nr:BlaI/MecI/CopY family transcriptional regulator [Pyrinomonadaceae bacterium]